MKQFSKALLATAIAFSATSALAGYDKFDCRTNEQMNMAGLECITCGIQKYYADKGTPVEVSDKWLTLIALNVQKEYGYNTVRSDIDKQNFQKEVIRRIQTYGFCSEYLGKKTKETRPSREYKDMSWADWKYYNEFLNRDIKISDKKMEEIASTLGFKDEFLGSNPAENMNYLFEGMFENRSLDEKRKIFKEKLKQALESDYTVSGERREKTKEFIAKGEKDQGLTRCLADLNEKFMKKPMGDKETHAFCGVIANSCDIARVNLDSQKDFCILKGMALKPASSKVQQPPVFSGGGYRPTPPPPPMPSRSGSGNK
ncbi:hypothetical protein Bb109J_c0885 [Bdellovibrio bacteriovorus]|uniref:hypothetical protein n=1 Tax=Bdellovibrio bacteriovorus TaxID=959 RepID=UPI00045BFD7E|nr:hypothetical protein [Bdellovibrio bacteriovorus]AHZ86228.1 hypothetical protein EP01_14990 [Bdellovibrio bacteriovorus]BEV67465.1 hypothetical protein Bb109J_c0885 [Bdellovibrio bacteriovorus]